VLHDPIDVFVGAVRNAAARVHTPAARRSLKAAEALVPMARRARLPVVPIPEPPAPIRRIDPHDLGEPDPALAWMYG